MRWRVSHSVRSRRQADTGSTARPCAQTAGPDAQTSAAQAVDDQGDVNLASYQMLAQQPQLVMGS
eukprot:6205728-Pleurochrysis_carterae.AAC.1